MVVKCVTHDFGQKLVQAFADAGGLAKLYPMDGPT
jgi:hypothetical protein